MDLCAVAAGTRLLPLTQVLTLLHENGIDITRAEIKGELEAVTSGDNVSLDTVLQHPDSIVCK